MGVHRGHFTSKFQQGSQWCFKTAPSEYNEPWHLVRDSANGRPLNYCSLWFECEMDPHSFMYWITWSPAGGNVSTGYGTFRKCSFTRGSILGAMQPNLGSSHEYLSSGFSWGKSPVETGFSLDQDQQSMGQQRNLQNLCTLQVLVSSYIVDSLGNFQLFFVSHICNSYNFSWESCFFSNISP